MLNTEWNEASLGDSKNLWVIVRSWRCFSSSMDGECIAVQFGTRSSSSTTRIGICFPAFGVVLSDRWLVSYEFSSS